MFIYCILSDPLTVVVLVIFIWFSYMHICGKYKTITIVLDQEFLHIKQFFTIIVILFLQPLMSIQWNSPLRMRWRVNQLMKLKYLNPIEDPIVPLLSARSIDWLLTELLEKRDFIDLHIRR